MPSLRHLGWIPAGALLAFLAAFVFGDLLPLPVDLYYFVYFTVVLGFLALYVRWTHLDLVTWVSRRWRRTLALGILFGFVMALNVLSRPETEHLTGGPLAWAVLWRGAVYGSVDGLILFAFPWVVSWRALGAEEGGPGRRVAASAVAWAMILVVTTVYHLGYGDFRSRKILQPNIGSAISAVPTLVAANPVASPLTHVFLHVTAVIHTPRTELFLPPHRP